MVAEDDFNAFIFSDYFSLLTIMLVEFKIIFLFFSIFGWQRISLGF